MKVEIKKSLKVGERAFTAPVLVYADMDEINKDAGNIQTAVDRLNGYLHAHGTANELRELIADITEEVSGIKREITDTKKKTKDGKAVTELEKEERYVNRVIAAKPELFDKVQALLDQRARGYTFKDEKGTEVKVEALAVDITTRVAGPKRPAKLAAKWIDHAKCFTLKQVNPNTKKPYDLANLNKAAKPVINETFTPLEGQELSSEANTNALGWFIKKFIEAREAQAKLAM